MKFFNQNGNVVKTAVFPTIIGRSHSRSFDVANLPEGSYMVKVDNRGRTIGTSKILLIK